MRLDAGIQIGVVRQVLAIGQPLLLVSGDRGLALQMKKGGLCKLSTATLQPGRCATLEWLLTSKQMALMA